MCLKFILILVASILCLVKGDVCVTPDGQSGNCVSVYHCPVMKDLLTHADSKEVRDYIRNSKCNGPDKYNVCCGSNTPSFEKTCESTAALPDRNSGCCGIESTSDRIVGGADAGLDQFPWLALIEYYDDEEVLHLLCGGALINGRYVLTAGHCVAGRILSQGVPRNVRLGEYDISNDPKEPDCVVTSGGGKDCTRGVTVIPIEKTIKYEEYDPNNRLRRHDIALIRLSEMAPYTDFIRPICLPETDTFEGPDPILYVAGWGRVNWTHPASLIKQYVDVPYVDDCQPAYSKGSLRISLWKGQICAGGELGKDSCNGDSGGPLMYERSKVYEAIGVVSFGPTPCGQENRPGVYTRVMQYLDWIKKNIEP